MDSGSTDDESAGDGRGLWMQLLLLSYSSAVTLGLGWVLWSGRAIHPADERGRDDAPRVDDPRAAKTVDAAARVELPPIPPANVALVGQTIRIGDVEITPLSVSFAPAELERKIEPAEYRLEEVSSLILRFKLTNLSSNHPLRPLARSLIRDAASALDRSFVATGNGGRIELYPLAVESEWLIVGQEFRSLKPGESAETLVTSEPVSEDRLRDDMTWRIRLRTGPYQSDILAVQFKRSGAQSVSEGVRVSAVAAQCRRPGETGAAPAALASLSGRPFDLAPILPIKPATRGSHAASSSSSDRPAWLDRCGANLRRSVRSRNAISSRRRSGPSSSASAARPPVPRLSWRATRGRNVRRARFSQRTKARPDDRAAIRRAARARQRLEATFRAERARSSRRARLRRARRAPGRRARCASGLGYRTRAPGRDWGAAAPAIARSAHSQATPARVAS